MSHRQIAALRFLILLLMTSLFLELPLGVSTVSSSTVVVAPKSVPGTVAQDQPSALPSDGSQGAPPPPSGQPTGTVRNLGKIMDHMIEEVAAFFDKFRNEKARMIAKQTLLALSEYMIYGGHKAAHCDKLVQWLDKIFEQDASLCQSIEGDISKDLHGKFQSQAYQVLFKQKFDFTQLKDNLTVDASVWKEIAIAEKATVLENARRLAPIIDTKGDGYSLYAISVLYTYRDIGRMILAESFKESGTSKGNLLAWAQKHPKYSAAGGSVGTLTLGGAAIALWNYFKASSTHQETKTSEKNETSLIPAQGEVKGKAGETKGEMPQLVAGIGFLVGAGVLFYLGISYCISNSHGNVQQAEGKKPKEKTVKQSEKKSKKSRKSAKSSTSTASKTASSSTAEKTST